MTKDQAKQLAVGDNVVFDGATDAVGAVVDKTWHGFAVQFPNVIANFRFADRGGLSALEQVQGNSAQMVDAIADAAVNHFAHGGTVDALAEKLAHAAPDVDVEPTWESDELAAGEIFYARVQQPNGEQRCFVRVGFKTAKAAPTFVHRIVEDRMGETAEVEGWVTKSGVSAKSGWTVNPACKGMAWIEALRPTEAR